MVLTRSGDRLKEVIDVMLHVRAQNLLTRRLGGFFAQQIHELFGLKRSQYRLQALGTFGMIVAGVMFQADRVREKERCHLFLRTSLRDIVSFMLKHRYGNFHSRFLHRAMSDG